MAARSPSVFAVAVLVVGLEPGLAQQMGQHMQFEPLLDSMMVLDMMDALDPPPGGKAALGGASAGAAGRRPSTHWKEDQMDRDMEAMFGSMLSSIGNPAPKKLGAGQPPLGARTGRPETTRDIESLPLEAFQGLFPGPLVFENGPADPMDIFGAGGPDPFIMEMLGETHSGFQDTMLPMVHAAAKQAPMSPPKLCHADILKHCGTARSRSQLHCLGAHQADISKGCRDSVGKSVPFVCSANIDKFCDTLHGGILPCLELHMEALGTDCKDAVATTRSVITTANTHKVKLASAQTGATASATPTPQALAEALKGLDRKVMAEALKAAQLVSSTSVSEAVRYVLYILSFSSLVYVLYTSPTIYIPEMVSSSKLVRQLQAARHEKLAVFGGWGGGSREGQRLLAGTELPKPEDGYML